MIYRVLLPALLSLALLAPTVKPAAGESVLSLRQALVEGLAANLELRGEQLFIPISHEDAATARARFHPVVESFVDGRGERTPTASAVIDRPYSRSHEYAGGAALRKEFATGLAARTGAQTLRRTDNSASEGLSPRYRSLLFLDLSQPLLRDFGTGVNTTDIRIADIRVQQARLDYLARTQRLAEQIELAYLELARAQRILELRIKARELAQELLEGNRAKFEAGIVPISEVQEAETAVAGRDEQVVFARQQREVAVNRLRDLLVIGAAHPAATLDLAITELPPPPATFPDNEAALLSALSQRPDLAARRLEITSRQIRLAFFENQRLPRLDLDASLGLNGLSGELRNGLLNEGSATRHRGDWSRSVSQLAEADGYNWFAGVRFSYPLGNQAAEAQARRAGHEKRQALYALQSLENTIETEISNALVDTRRGLERLQVAQRFEQLAETTLEQEMERLAEGLSDTFRILDFQASLIEAQIRHANAFVDSHQGLASLYRAMGANLERHGILHDLSPRELSP